MRRWIICGILTAALTALIIYHSVLIAPLPENRVEVLFSGGKACWDTAAMDDFQIEEAADRYIVKNPDVFTAQEISAILNRWGADAESVQVLDYSWAEAVIRQSLTLWKLIGAVLASIGILKILLWQGTQELSRYRAAMTSEYPGPYFSRTGDRILMKLIGGVLLIFLTVVLLRWVVQEPLVLPAGLLPKGGPLRLTLWLDAAFPQGALSPYGAALKALLCSSYRLAAMESILLLCLWAGISVQIRGVK